MKYTILIIETDKDFANYLKSTLIDNNFEVKIMDSEVSALTELEKGKVDLIISEYYLPNLRGDEFYKRIRDLFSDIPIIFLSHQAHKGAIKSVLSHPHADYMVKPVVIEELIARIESALQEGQVVRGKKILKVKDLKLDLENFEAKRGDNEIELSPTEFALLRYMIINKNRVLTRGMLLGRIWGYDSDVSTRVVDVYIGYLRDKIDKDQDDKLIETVRGFGYKINA